MLKLCLLVGGVSLFVALLLRTLLSRRGDYEGEPVAQIPTQRVLQELCAYEICPGGKEVRFRDGRFHIPPRIAEAREVAVQGEALLALGLVLLGQETSSWLLRHRSMLLFDHLILPFSIIICVFGVIAKTFPPQLGLSVVCIALCLNCLNNFYLSWVRHLAMKLVLARMERLELYTKHENREAAEAVLRGIAPQLLLPTPLRWLFR